MKYTSYNLSNDTYTPVKKSSMEEALIPGIYRLEYNEWLGEVLFSVQKTNYDELLRLPGTEYDKVMTEIDKFITPETKAVFKEYGFLYKRGIFLHGVPGTGKTCIVNRVAEQVVEAGGLVFFNPEPFLLKKAFNVLDDIQPETLVMVILEEFDTTIKLDESEFLSILDGEIQKNNVIYVATTNYIENVPTRVYRPGRFSSVIEVGFPPVEARSYYLQYKLQSSEAEVSELAEITEGLSIDELKEVVLAVKCLGHDVNDTVNRLRALKEFQESQSEKRP